MFFPLEIVLFPGWERLCFTHLCVDLGQRKVKAGRMRGVRE
jgi:hypothetical protein